MDIIIEFFDSTFLRICVGRPQNAKPIVSTNLNNIGLIKFEKSNLSANLTNMNRLFFILFSFLLLQGCDDGEVIVRDLDFENVSLKTCGTVGNYVFYKENTQAFQSLSLRLGTMDSLYKIEGTKTYELSGTTNFVNYRSYDGALGNSYFCNSIPPTTPKIETNYLAVSGSAQVIVTFNPDGNTIVKSVQIILKDLVLVSGDNQLIQETLDMGVIENVQP